MERQRKIYLGKCAAIAVAAPFLVWAYAGGPPARNTGAPGDRTCAQAGCHAGTANSGPGRVIITAESGTTYTPGATQKITVRVEDPTMRRWGYQLAARLDSNSQNGQAGSFAAADTNSEITCEDDSLAPCRVSPLQFAQHTSRGTRNGTTGGASFEVNWTAPAAGAGPITLYAAGNAANGDGNNTGDRVYTASLRLSPAAGGGGGNRPAISNNGVVNAASFATTIAPGGWVTVAGTNLSETTRTWAAADIVNNALPTRLDNVSVSIGGRAAYVFFVSPTLVSALAPTDVPLGPVQVEVARGAERSAAATVTSQNFSPGFFLWGGKYPATTRPDFTLVGPPSLFPGASTPARPGDTIILWGTGFGPTTPATPSGRVITETHNVATPPVVRIGGMPAPYVGGALAPGAAGLYQIVVRVPENAANGELPVEGEAGGIAFPSGVVLAVQR